MNAHHSIAEADAHIRALSSLQPVVAVTSDRCASPNIASVTWELAQAGIEAQRSVAVADFDSESPQLHRFLNRDQGPGLIDILYRQQHFADVIDFRLTRTSRFVALTHGAESAVATDDLVSLAAPTIESLVDLAETVLLIAGPLTSRTARDVVARADAVIVVVGGNAHLGWPDGRPAEMAGIDTKVIGWVADRGSLLPPAAAPPVPEEPLVEVASSAPIVDVRGSIEDHRVSAGNPIESAPPVEVASGPPAATTGVSAGPGLELLWQKTERATSAGSAVEEPQTVDEAEVADPEQKRGRGFLGRIRRSHYLD